MFKMNKIAFTRVFWQDAVKQGKAGKEELQILLTIYYQLKKFGKSLVHESHNMKKGLRQECAISRGRDEGKCWCHHH